MSDQELPAGAAAIADVGLSAFGSRVSGNWASFLAHCPFCGKPFAPVLVHGHMQCAACGAVVERCCGEP
jgi:hypothetical protein